MHKKYSLKIIVGLLIVSVYATVVFGFYIHNEPLTEVFTQKALYQDKILKNKFVVGDRTRFSTCSGVAWFHDNNYVATVNFEGGFICTYRFDKSENKFIHLQTIHDSKESQLFGSDNIAFSSDGQLLAVSGNHAQRINLYHVNTKTHHIDPVPAAIVHHKDRGVHGIRFSHHNKYLACTTIRGSCVVTVYKLGEATKQGESSTIQLTRVSKLANRFLPLKPKALDFTYDDAYVAVVYAANVIAVPNKTEGLIAFHKFDKATGIIASRPTSVHRDDKEFVGGEDINFSPDGAYVIVSEHARDRIIVYEFDKIHGKIGKKVSELKNPESKLSFPHGLTISSDGKYLAVANYGDDKFSIYAID